MAKPEEKIIIASDVSDRDGIGIEIYHNNELVLEIFRNDSEKTRTITSYNKDMPLELMEKAIQIFRQDIPWDFIDD